MRKKLAQLSKSVKYKHIIALSRIGRWLVIEKYPVSASSSPILIESTNSPESNNVTFNNTKK